MEEQWARKRPVLVGYVEMTDSNGAEVAQWCGGEWRPDTGEVLVPTIHGQTAATADGLRYVMHQLEPEEYYPIRADVFARVYSGLGDGRDWLAVREWLIKARARADAEGFLGAEMLSAALDFMDAQVRQAAP